jgi:hypothetical protein
VLLSRACYRTSDPNLLYLAQKHAISSVILLLYIYKRPISYVNTQILPEPPVFPSVSARPPSLLRRTDHVPCLWFLRSFGLQPSVPRSLGSVTKPWLRRGSQVGIDSFILHNDTLYLLQMTTSAADDIKEKLVPFLLSLKGTPSRSRWYFIFVKPSLHILACPVPKCTVLQDLVLYSAEVEVKS